MNTKNEVKYAVGMVERRMEEATTIGKADSVKRATQTYRSMTSAVREVTKHHANILNHIDDSTARNASEVLELLVTVTDWRARARTDLVRWGLTEGEIANIDREVGI